MKQSFSFLILSAYEEKVNIGGGFIYLLKVDTIMIFLRTNCSTFHFDDKMNMAQSIIK